MPEYNGNAVHINVNSTNVAALWKGFEIKESIDKEDTSAGADSEYKKNASKLKERTGKLTLAYHTSSAPTDISALYGLSADHIIPIVYGPEGNAAGKPKDDCDWLITAINGPTTKVDKPAVLWEIDVVSAAAPRTNIYNGGTF
jgi:hypothetical protein